VFNSYISNDRAIPNSIDRKIPLRQLNWQSRTIKQISFKNRHRRITHYLENDVYADLKILRNSEMSQSRIRKEALINDISK
jgi:hypothetical protein